MISQKIATSPPRCKTCEIRNACSCDRCCPVLQHHTPEFIGNDFRTISVKVTCPECEYKALQFYCTNGPEQKIGND